MFSSVSDFVDDDDWRKEGCWSPFGGDWRGGGGVAPVGSRLSVRIEGLRSEGVVVFGSGEEEEFVTSGGSFERESNDGGREGDDGAVRG